MIESNVGSHLGADYMERAGLGHLPLISAYAVKCMYRYQSFSMQLLL